MIDLYVRDRFSGEIHRIGDNQHDMLTIGEDGELHYQNLQNGDGCKTGENHLGAGYEFVPNEDDYGYNCDPREDLNLADLPIKMVHICMGDDAWECKKCHKRYRTFGDEPVFRCDCGQMLYKPTKWDK